MVPVGNRIGNWHHDGSPVLCQKAYYVVFQIADRIKLSQQLTVQAYSSVFNNSYWHSFGRVQDETYGVIDIVSPLRIHFVHFVHRTVNVTNQHLFVAETLIPSWW